MIRSARLVRKRDGREVPFDTGKIVDAIWRAARAVGGLDRLLAEELGAVVAMFIERDFTDRTPSIDDVSDLIEKVLVETGHTKTAKAFILERERRDRMRNALRVRDDGAEHARKNGEATPPTVDTRGKSAVSNWSKTRIVEALVVEAELPENVASEIAAEVERRVFASGMTRISTSLIRALVDNELFERGYDRFIHRQSVLGLPRFDLDRIARSGVEREGEAPSFGSSVDFAVAHASWTQYSLLEIHDAVVADAHANGRIHLGALACPTRFQSIAVDVRRTENPFIVDAERTASIGDGLRLLAARAASCAAESVVLRGVADSVAPVLSAGVEPRAVARRLLLALAAPSGADAHACRVELELPLVPPQSSARIASSANVAWAAFVHELVAEIGRLDLKIHAPRIVFRLDGAASVDPDVLAAVALAEAHGDRIGVRAGEAQPIASPIVPRIGRVDVNVANAVLRVPRGDRLAALDQLKTAIGYAGTGLAARVRYFDSLVGAASPRERAKAAFGASNVGFGSLEITLAGLDAAARVFTGESLVTPTGRSFANVLLDTARTALAAESSAHRLPFSLAICDDRATLARFGKLDAERFGRGRETSMIPNDGSRFVYSGSLPALPLDGAGEAAPDAVAEIESELRRGLAPALVTCPFGAVEDRVAFLVALDPRMREDRLSCA